jgi:hypothetical protein
MVIALTTDYRPDPANPKTAWAGVAAETTGNLKLGTYLTTRKRLKIRGLAGSLSSLRSMW